MLATKSHVTYRHILAPFLAPLFTVNRLSRRNHAAQLQLLRQRQQQRLLWGFGWNSKEEIAKETVQKAQHIFALQEQQEKERQEQKQLEKERREKERLEKQQRAKQKQQEKEEQEKKERQLKQEKLQSPDQTSESPHEKNESTNPTTVGAVLETPPPIGFVSIGTTASDSSQSETSLDNTGQSTKNSDAPDESNMIDLGQTATSRKDKHVKYLEEDDLPLQSTSLKDTFKEYPKSRQAYSNQSAEQMLGLKSEDAASRLAAMLSRVSLDSNAATNSSTIASNIGRGSRVQPASSQSKPSMNDQSALGVSQDNTAGSSPTARSVPLPWDPASSKPPVPTPPLPSETKNDNEVSAAAASNAEPPKYPVTGAISGLDPWNPPTLDSKPDWPSQVPPTWHIPTPFHSSSLPPLEKPQRQSTKSGRSSSHSESLVDWMSRPPRETSRRRSNQNLNNSAKSNKDPNLYPPPDLGTAQEQKLMDDYLDRWSSGEAEGGDKEMEAWENLEDKERKPILGDQGNNPQSIEQAGDKTVQDGQLSFAFRRVDVNEQSSDDIARERARIPIPKLTKVIYESSSLPQKEDSSSPLDSSSGNRLSARDRPPRNDSRGVKRELSEQEEEKEENDSHEVDTGSLDFSTTTKTEMHAPDYEQVETLSREDTGISWAWRNTSHDEEELAEEKPEDEFEEGKEIEEPVNERGRKLIRRTEQYLKSLDSEETEFGSFTVAGFSPSRLSFMRYKPPLKGKRPQTTGKTPKELPGSQKAAGHQKTPDEGLENESEDHSHESETEIDRNISQSILGSPRTKPRITKLRPVTHHWKPKKIEDTEEVEDDVKNLQDMESDTTERGEKVTRRIKSSRSVSQNNSAAAATSAKAKEVPKQQTQSQQKQSKQQQQPRVGTPHTGDSFETYTPLDDSDVQFPRNIPDRLPPTNSISSSNTARYDALRKKLEAGLQQLRELEEAEQSRELVEKDVETTLAELKIAAKVEKQYHEKLLQQLKEQQQQYQQSYLGQQLQSYPPQPPYYPPQPYYPQPPYYPPQNQAQYSQYPPPQQYPSPQYPSQQYPPHQQLPSHYPQPPHNYWDETLQQQHVDQEKFDYAESQDTQWHHPEQDLPEEEKAESYSTQDPSAWKQYITDIQGDVKAYEIPESAPAWDGVGDTPSQQEGEDASIITPYSVSAPPPPLPPSKKAVSNEKGDTTGEKPKKAKAKRRVYIENPGRGDTPPEGWVGPWDPEGAALRKLQRVLQFDKIRLQQLKEDATKVTDDEEKEMYAKRVRHEEKKLGVIERTIQHKKKIMEVRENMKKLAEEREEDMKKETGEDKEKKKKKNGNGKE